MFLLGLDYGTGGAKAMIIDTRGGVLGYAFEEYPILTPHPGWSEPDPQKHQMYMEYFDLYKKLYDYVRSDYRALAALREKHHASRTTQE